MIVFTAQLEVTEHDRYLRTCDYQDQENNEKETKDVVVLVQPYGGQDEEEFNENSSKWENTPDKYRKRWLHVPCLLW